MKNKTHLDGHVWYVEDGIVVIDGIVTLTGDELNDMICELEQECPTDVTALHIEDAKEEV